MAVSKVASLRSVWQYGVRFHRALGVKRAMLLHVVGTAAAVLYAAGIAAMWPVLAMLVGTQGGSTAGMMNGVKGAISSSWSPGAILIFLGVVVAIMFMLRMACLGIFNAYGGSCAESYAVEIRRSLLAAYSRVREEAPSQHARSTILYLSAQIQQLNTFHWAILASCQLFYLVVFIVAANIVISPIAFLAAVGAVALLAPVVQPLFRRTMVLGDRLFAYYHTLLCKTNDYIEGFDTLTTLNVRKDVARQIDETGEQTTHLHVALGTIQGVVSGMPEVLISLFLVGWILVAGGRQMDAPLLAVAAYSIVRLLGTFNQLNEKLNELLKLKKTPEEIYAFLDQAGIGGSERPADGDRKVVDGRSVEKISFQDVRVSIAGVSLVEGVTVCLQWPGLYQFSGPNGSGKSTALRALVGLLPYTGCIRINDWEARDLSRADLSNLISYHGQDNFLLEGTILENLLLGVRGKGEQDVLRLIRSMKLGKHPLLSRGLGQPISEGANNLSGGERQLLCILRTLLRDTPAYILDEFTNHLSRHVAAAVMDYLKTMEDRIVIVVSHNATGFAKMDVRFDHGRMVEIVSMPVDGHPAAMVSKG